MWPALNQFNPRHLKTKLLKPKHKPRTLWEKTPFRLAVPLTKRCRKQQKLLRRLPKKLATEIVRLRGCLRKRLLRKRLRASKQESY
jgi:hypothetical protein